MPKSSRPAASGYARLAQAEEEEEDDLDYSDDEQQAVLSRESLDTRYAPIQPGQRPALPGASKSTGGNAAGSKRKKPKRRRRNSGVDVKAINARLERWAEEIASKFKVKRKGRDYDEDSLEIHYSVFQPPEGVRPVTADELPQFMDYPEDRMTKMQYDDVVESVRVAIELGVHPKMITQGSSGSYFARNSDGKVVGVFKPKDEEPYASRNPKWTKWIHRNLFPFFFGRACLIPNLSYVSEAAAYVLDTRLQTNIVPYTDVVYFTSIVFNHDFWDRRAYYRRRKPLPAKVGSLQVFLKGYRDATQFLKEQPWPDQSGTARPASRGRRTWAGQCRPGSSAYEEEEEEAEEEEESVGQAETKRRKRFWTDALQLSFREELEKLVILDYIMRNTDRGLDNWMIHIDEESQKASLIAEPPESGDIGSRSRSPYARQTIMTPTGSANDDKGPKPKVRIGAIDNSLSWPWKHPDAWRSFPFGWLFLPVSLIGQPFTEKTRRHFLPLLTSKQWWMDTQAALRHCFKQDSDFQEKMFAKQVAIVKGQAWNVVETLKTPGHGPLELTRRNRVHVWDDVVDVPTVVHMQTSPVHSPGRTRNTAEPPEEMDIGAAGSQSLDQSLLDLGQQQNGMPTTTKFKLSRHASEENARYTPDKSKGRQEGRRQGSGHKGRRRNFSFTARAMSDYEDDDGDLGYAAARDMEGNRKKVIVERLETVKSKNPVFTWC